MADEIIISFFRKLSINRGVEFGFVAKAEMPMFAGIHSCSRDSTTNYRIKYIVRFDKLR
jgi:hypothetical protein